MQKTPAELINGKLRRELLAKRRELALRVPNVLGEDEKLRRQAQSAIRRIHQSIALRTAKLLCEHVIETRTMMRHGTNHKVHRCTACKSTATE